MILNSTKGEIQSVIEIVHLSSRNTIAKVKGIY
jgi:hypothetical protein